MYEAANNFSNKFGRVIAIRPDDDVFTYSPNTKYSQMPCRILLGTERHWRTLNNTHHTFFTHVDVFKNYWELFASLAKYYKITTVNEDGTINTIWSDGVSKWFITGADGSDYVIIMARTEDNQATMFLSDMNAPGIEIERNMESMDQCFAGGHSVLRFTNLRILADQILGELGKGFRYAQVRLAPARLTHCMRWLGQARRAHDIALAYAQKRQAFGQRLGDHEGVGFMLADNDIDLQTARLHILHTAWLLDQGQKCNYESSRAKVVCSEAQWRVVDRCVQIMGGQGVTGESAVMRIFTDMRAFRIYDGPSEVHRWSMARKLLDQTR